MKKIINGLAFDYDGTLSGFHADTRAWIRKILAKGVRANVLATSRGRDEPVVYELGTFYEFTHLVLENGSLVLAKGASGWAPLSMPSAFASDGVDALYAHLLDEVKTAEFVKLPHVSVPQTMRKVFLSRPNEWTLLEKKSHSFEIKGGNQTVREAVIAIAESARLALALPLQRVDDQNGVMYGLGNKWSGLQQVEAALDGSPVHWLAVGDGLNDLSMLAPATLAACPANAAPLVRSVVTAQAGLVLDQEGAQGVCQALELVLRHHLQSS